MSEDGTVMVAGAMKTGADTAEVPRVFVLSADDGSILREVPLPRREPWLRTSVYDLDLRRSPDGQCAALIANVPSGPKIAAMRNAGGKAEWHEVPLASRDLFVVAVTNDGDLIIEMDGCIWRMTYPWTGPPTAFLQVRRPD